MNTAKLLFLLLAGNALGATSQITSLTLVNQTTGVRLPFTDGMTLRTGNTYFVRADCNAATQSVTFQLNNFAPTLDNDPIYKSVPGQLQQGSDKLTIRTFARNNAKAPGGFKTVSFTVAQLSPTPTTTPTPSPSPTPPVSPTATPTATPSPSPSPTTISVTIQVVTPTAGDTYWFYMGTTPGNIAVLPNQIGAANFAVSGLLPNTTYLFADTVERAGMESAMSVPISYTTTAALRQRIRLP